MCIGVHFKGNFLDLDVAKLGFQKPPESFACFLTLRRVAASDETKKVLLKHGCSELNVCVTPKLIC